MPNTRSARKAVRGSIKKHKHNEYWKNRYKTSIKGLKTALTSTNGKDVTGEKLQVLQKVLDKASKEKVIHKNKANRLKSRYARKVSALSKPSAKQRKHS